MRRQVTLHGPLAARFGPQTIPLNVDDFQSLLSGLNCAYPGFTRELAKHEGMAVALVKDDQATFISEESLGWNFGDQPEVHIATAERGSWEAAAWVASWATTAQGAATATTWATATGWTAVAYAAVYAATLVAIGLAVSKVSSALAEKPEANGPSKELDSALFDQAVNLQGQGHPVPLVYGTFKVGSVVISADVISEKNSVAMDDHWISKTTTFSENVFGNDIDAPALTVIAFSLGTTWYAPGAVASEGDYTLTVLANGDFTVNKVGTTTDRIGFGYVAESTSVRGTTNKTNASVSVIFDLPLPPPEST